MQRRLCAAILSLEAIVLGLSTPVLISVAGVSTGGTSSSPESVAEKLVPGPVSSSPQAEIRGSRPANASGRMRRAFMGDSFRLPHTSRRSSQDLVAG